jgi:hypothetical protein
MEVVLIIVFIAYKHSNYLVLKMDSLIFHLYFLDLLCLEVEVLGSSGFIPIFISATSAIPSIQ